MNERVRVSTILWALLSCALGGHSHADVLPAAGTTDPRVREATYSAEEVYRLYGFVGYQIDLQFAPDETFVGLGAGDMEGIAFASEANHLFLKPKVAKVGTNLTILTSKRHYQIDYSASSRRPDELNDEVIYALRFVYPEEPGARDDTELKRAREQLSQLAQGRGRNLDYWFCAIRR